MKYNDVYRPTRELNDQDMVLLNMARPFASGRVMLPTQAKRALEEIAQVELLPPSARRLSHSSTGSSIKACPRNSHARPHSP